VQEYLRSLYYKPSSENRQDVLKALIRPTRIPNAADVNSSTPEKKVNPRLEVR
jgi:hypothetical protein